MKNKAFTLIELLVVILIIGVLASIGLAQYKKSVLKARFAQLIPTVTRMALAAQEYELINGNCTTDLSKMDIDMNGFTYGPYATVTVSFDNVLLAPNGNFFLARCDKNMLAVEGYVSSKQSFGYRVLLRINKVFGYKPGRYCVEADMFSSYDKYCHIITGDNSKNTSNWHGRWYPLN